MKTAATAAKEGFGTFLRSQRLLSRGEFLELGRAVVPRGQRVLSANNSGCESQRREESDGKEVLAAVVFRCLLLSVSGAARTHSRYFPSWRNTFSIGSREIRMSPANG